MFRTTVLAIALSLVGCHREPRPMTPKEGELPPLPPASGTPVGYLLDSAATLKLREDQVEELKKLDATSRRATTRSTRSSARSRSQRRSRRRIGQTLVRYDRCDPSRRSHG